MIDVTLINPLTSSRRMPPLGLLYVAGYLEAHGVTVKVVNPLFSHREEYSSDSPYTGITCMSNQWSKVKEIAGEIKKKNPDTTVIVGGVHPTVATDEVIGNPNVDVAVVGEGEKAMLRIVAYNIKKGIVKDEAILNLDEIPHPARHLVDMKWYSQRDTVVPFQWLKATNVMTSRGCPASCNFCINSKHAMFGRKIRFHSANYVIEEVESLVSKYGLEGIYFFDDNFVIDRKRLIEICERIKRFDLEWFCQSRVDTLNRETLIAMKNAGCVGIAFGVESGSPKVLEAINKKAKVEDAIEVFDLCRQVGVKTLANIMIGNPEETWEDITLTDKLLKRINADYVQVWNLTPYQGTVIYDQATEHGWIKNTSLIGEEPQMEINFTLKELAELRKTFLRKYNSTLSSLWPYIQKPVFIHDMLRLLAMKPSLLFKGVEAWQEESRKC